MARRLSLVAIDHEQGSFVVRVHDKSLLIAPSIRDGCDSPIDTYLHNDSPVDGDEHDWIVCGEFVAVSTDSLNRTESLANEMVEYFNSENYDGSKH